MGANQGAKASTFVKRGTAGSRLPNLRQCDSMPELLGQKPATAPGGMQRRFSRGDGGGEEREATIVAAALEAAAISAGIGAHASGVLGVSLRPSSDGAGAQAPGPELAGAAQAPPWPREKSLIMAASAFELESHVRKHAEAYGNQQLGSSHLEVSPPLRIEELVIRGCRSQAR